LCTYIGKDDLGYTDPTVILAYPYQSIQCIQTPRGGRRTAQSGLAARDPRAQRAILYSLLTTSMIQLLNRKRYLQFAFTKIKYL
jgi:hypothetical protein